MKLKTLRINLTLKLLIGSGAVLIITFGTLFYFLIQHQERLIFGQVENEARTLFKQIVLTRRWIADHGGIFVERLPWVKPNPYLSDKEAEISDIKGRKFVKQSPAMVTKELSKYAKEKEVFWFHITSLKLINPENAPDDFERESLMLFEEGKAREYSRLEKIENYRYLRYIAPLHVESACLDCHTKQGYRIGDVRGAISVTVPVEDVFARLKGSRAYMLFAVVFTTAVLLILQYTIINTMVLSPIHRLNTSLKSISPKIYTPGDMEAWGDEIECLSRSFSEILQSLTEHHNSLESRVRSAVKELEDTNKRLMETNEQLMAINRNKSDFVAKVSHELRTPLTSIRGAMDYISARLQSIINAPDRGNPPEREDIHGVENVKKLDDLLTFFEIIKKNAERLIRMVNDILDLERIEQGQAEMHFTTVDMSMLIEEVATGLKSSAIQRNIDIHIETPGNLIVNADEDRIRQVLINLLSNALKFSPDSSTINIKAVPAEECIMIIVKDNGSGIPPDEQGKIFDRFYKKSDKEGTGLGLAISKGIIEAHRGIIGVISDGQSGSSFFFKIPKAMEKGICKIRSSL